MAKIENVQIKIAILMIALLVGNYFWTFKYHRVVYSDAERIELQKMKEEATYSTEELAESLNDYLGNLAAGIDPKRYSQSGLDDKSLVKRYIEDYPEYQSKVDLVGRIKTIEQFYIEELLILISGIFLLYLTRKTK